jgi:two-component system alkaline phosphatase synthesis response regulator PhoP
MTNNGKRILLVEDESHLQEALKLNLEMDGFTVDAAGDAFTALNLFKENEYNCAVLDVMLPDMDGLRLCENIRMYNNTLPVLFLSAKNTSEDRVAGLKRGGDDYVAKPFNLEELLLRIQNLISKSDRAVASQKISSIYRFGKNNMINFETYDAQGVTESMKLTKKEMMLLKLLIENKNIIISREKILHTVWGYKVVPITRTIDNFILTYRKCFEEDPHNPKHFISHRGVGYEFRE